MKRMLNTPSRDTGVAVVGITRDTASLERDSIQTPKKIGLITQFKYGEEDLIIP